MSAQPAAYVEPRVPIWPRVRHILDRALTYAILLVIGIIMVTPFVAMLSLSLKNIGGFYQYPFEWIPEVITWANYQLLFRGSEIIRWTFNSFVVAGGCALLQVVTASLAGYAFARKEFRGRQLIFWMMLVQLILPYHVTIIPVFILLSKLQLVDTYWAFWLPFATSVFSTFLMRQAMLTIPRDYDEAARIDGANDFQIWWRIMLPMCRPTVIVLIIFTFLQLWNDFFFALIVVQSDQMRTLQVGLAQLQPIGGQPGVLMAGSVFAFLPTFLLFVVLQRQLIEGLQAGGVKS
jgi:ABC-type glycerol-3-phosphate transport system permease component